MCFAPCRQAPSLQQAALAMRQAPSGHSAVLPACWLSCFMPTQGRLHEAIAAYEQALSAAPNLEVVKLNLAAALTQYGTQAKAAGDARSAHVWPRACVRCSVFCKGLRSAEPKAMWQRSGTRLAGCRVQWRRSLVRHHLKAAACPRFSSVAASARPPRRCGSPAEQLPQRPSALGRLQARWRGAWLRTSGRWRWHLAMPKLCITLEWLTPSRAR